MNWTIRNGRAGDEIDLMALLPMTSGRTAEVVQDELRRALTTEQEAGRRLYLLATEGERVIGYSQAQLFTPPEAPPDRCVPPGGYLMGVFVHKDYRRQGVARAFMAPRIAWLRPRCHDIYYFTGPENHVSVALHAAVGFEPVATNMSIPGAPLMVGKTLHRLF
ncbi:MAG: GNAT superfamily N-acetyltransferase [Myxococcota bacterium]